jgi:nicotinate-nucleotide adenylyltransferase
MLMPVAVPPHKEAPDDPGPEHRVELCRHAVAGDERFAVSTLEVERGGPSYTVATLRALHALHPEDQLTFIAGGDMARELGSWREPGEVLRLATFAVAERDGAGRRELAAVAAELGGADRIAFFDMPRIDVSSSLVRRRLAEGRSVRYLVPEAVAAYAREHGLYAGAVGAPR